MKLDKLVTCGEKKFKNTIERYRSAYMLLGIQVEETIDDSSCFMIPNNDSLGKIEIVIGR